MPTLYVYLGLSGVDILKFKSQSDFEFKKLPYAYSKAVFSNLVNPRDYYFKLLELISKEMKVKMKPDEFVIGCSPYVSCRLEGYECIGVIDILKKIRTNWILADGFSVITPHHFVSYFPYKHRDYDSSEALDYFSNKYLFPQTLFSDQTSLDYFDCLTRKFIPEILTPFDSERPVIFSGERFKNYESSEPYTYLLMLDLIRSQGFFNLKLDDFSKLSLSSLFSSKINLNKLEVNSLLETLDEVDYISVGTLLNTLGAVEILFETDVGSSQFIKLKENEIFIFPLYSEEKARVVVSNKNLGDIEKEVSGGTLGFIVDTRNKENGIYLENTFRQPFIKEWMSVFEEAGKGF